MDKKPKKFSYDKKAFRKSLMCTHIPILVPLLIERVTTGGIQPETFMALFMISGIGAMIAAFRWVDLLDRKRPELHVTEFSFSSAFYRIPVPYANETELNTRLMILLKWVLTVAAAWFSSFLFSSDL